MIQYPGFSYPVFRIFLSYFDWKKYYKRFQKSPNVLIRFEKKSSLVAFLLNKGSLILLELVYDILLRKATTCSLWGQHKSNVRDRPTNTLLFHQYFLTVFLFFQHGIDSDAPLKYTHLDIAGSEGEFPGIPTGSPVPALINRHLGL